jgi:hypothetical protein
VRRLPLAACRAARPPRRPVRPADDIGQAALANPRPAAGRQSPG